MHPYSENCLMINRAVTYINSQPSRDIKPLHCNSLASNAQPLCHLPKSWPDLRSSGLEYAEGGESWHFWTPMPLFDQNVRRKSLAYHAFAFDDVGNEVEATVFIRGQIQVALRSEESIELCFRSGLVSQLEEVDWLFFHQSDLQVVKGKILINI